MPRLRAGEGTATWISELRAGVMAHDPSFMSGKEKGADINGELLFVTPFPRGWAEGASPRWRWLLEPRPHVGFSASTARATNVGYAGLTWTVPLARDLFQPNDALRLDLFGGGAVHDGLHFSREPDRNSMGSSLAFRVGGEIGYQITPRYSVSAYLAHISNATLARHNQGLNSLGMRFGIGF